MRQDDRDPIREALPDWIGGRLEERRAEAVGRAVEADPDLRAEADLLRSVAAGRTPAPEGLDVRIAAAVLRDQRGSGDRRGSGAAVLSDGVERGRWLGVRTPVWALAAAAALVLVLGTFELVDRAGTAGGAEMDALLAAMSSPHTPWVADDGTVAGAAVLDGLSEEALASLLEEMGG